MPTLASDSLWTPPSTPSPTPYVQTTFAPITDPDLSWMDYISGKDENENYNNQAGSVRTPTPRPNATPRPTSQIINGNSSATEITDLPVAADRPGLAGRAPAPPARMTAPPGRPCAISRPI